MSDDVKTNLIWGTVVAIGIMTIGALIWQGVETSQRNKIVCMEAGGTWIGGSGHCIQ